MSKPRLILAASIVSLFALADPPKTGAQTFTWDGLGGDDNFGTGANWTPDGVPSVGNTVDLVFTGNTRLTPNNNYTAFDDFRSFLFDAAAGAFTIGGNAIDLFGKIENLSTATQTISLASIALNSATANEFNAINGNLTITSANIFTNGNTLNVFGNNGKTLTIAGNIQQGGLLKVRENTNVVLTGVSTGTGNIEIDAGSVEIATGAGISPTSSIFIGNGTTTGTAAAFWLNVPGGGYNLANAIQINPGNGTNRTIASLNTTGTNIFSGTVALQDNLNLVTAAGGNTTFSNVISGAGGLNISGGGKVTLTGINTFTGAAVNVTGGSTLAVSSSGTSGQQINGADLASPLGGPGARSFTFDNATLNVTAGTVNPTLAGGKNFVVGAGGATFDIASGAVLQLDDANQFSGTGVLTKTGAGNMLLGSSSASFANFTGGSILLNQGALILQGNAGAAGTTTKAVITMASGTTLALRANGATGINFANNVITNGTATITSGSSSTNNGSTQTIGTLSLGGTNPVLTVGNGSNLNANSAGSIRAGATTVTGTGNVQFTVNTNGSGLNVLFLASLDEGAAARTFTKTGGGTLRIDNASTISSGSSFTVTGGKIETGNLAGFGNAAITLNGGNLDLRSDVVGVFNNPLTLTTSQTVSSGRTSGTAANPGLQHVASTLALGAVTYTLTGANLLANTPYGLAHTTTTLSGNPTFSVANNGTATGTLTLGEIIDGGVARTITKSNLGNLVLSTTPASQAAGSIFNVIAGNLVAGADGVFTNATINVGDQTAANTTPSGVYAGAAGVTIGNTLNISQVGTGTRTLGGLHTSGTSTFTAGVTMAGNVQLDAAAGGTVVFPGNFDDGAGSFSLTKIGGGVVVLQGTNTYDGGTTINAGSLQFDSPAAIGGTGANVTINSPGAAAVGYAIDQAFLARVVNTSTGGVALAADSSNNLDFTGFPNLRLGAVGTRTYSGALTPDGTTYRLGGGTGVLVLSNANALTGAGNSLDVQSTGVVSLTAANNYGGATSVTNGGTLRLSATNNLGTAPDLTLNGGTAQFGASFDLSTIPVSIGTGGATIDTNGNDVTFNSAIGGVSTTGTLTKTGAGILTLNAAPTNTGILTLAGGSLTFSDVAVLANAPSLSGAGGALRYTGITGITLGKPIALTAAANALTIDVSNAAGTLTQADSTAIISGGPATGTVGLTKIGPGTLALSGIAANTFTGNVLISDGTLSIIGANGNNALGAGNHAIVIDGGRLQVNTSNFDPGTGTEFFVIGPSGGTIDTGSGVLFTLNDNGPGTANANPQFGGTGTLTKTGTGALILGSTTAANYNFSGYTGAIQVNEGTIRAIGNSTPLGATTAGTTVASGAVLDVQSVTAFAEPITLSGTGISSAGALINSSSGAATLVGPITLAADASVGGTGSGGLTIQAATAADGLAGAFKFTKVATGTLTLAAANPNFTGIFEVNAGTVNMNVANPLAGASSLTINGGIVNLNTPTFGPTPAIAVNAGGKLAPNLANYDVAALPAITWAPGGFLRLTQSMDPGSGATLPATAVGGLDIANAAVGANYDGVQILSGGSLTATVAAADYASDVVLLGPVNLDFAGSNTFTVSGVLSGAGGLNRTNTTAFDLTLAGTAANTFAGAVQWNRGTLTLNKPAGVDAISGSSLSLFTQAGGSAIVSLGANEQIADSMPILLHATTSLFTRLSLNNFTETVGQLTLRSETNGTSNQSSLVQTGATGTLKLAGDLNFEANRNSSGTPQRNLLITGTGNIATVTTDGTLDLNGARNISVTSTVVGGNLAGNDAVIDTVIANGGIVKKGSRYLVLTNPGNTFAGGIRAEGGFVRGLGPAGAPANIFGTGSITFAGGGVSLSNDGTAVGATTAYNYTAAFDPAATLGAVEVTSPSASRNSILTLNSLTFTGPGQQLDVTGANGASLQFGAVTLAGTPTFNLATTTRIPGLLSGTGGFNKMGASGLTIGTQSGSGDSTPNTYTGTVTLSGGGLNLNKDAGITAINGDLNMVTGAGTVQQVNDEQYADTANVSIAAGTLNFGNGTTGADETIASLNVSGGTVNINNKVSAADITTLIVGALNLSGGNTILGSDGTELLVGAGGLNFTHSGGTLLTLNRSTAAGAVANMVVLGGNVTFAAGASTATGATAIAYGGTGTFTTTPTLDLGGATRTFDIADNTSAATDLSVAVVLANGSLIKTGAGAMTISTQIPASVNTVTVSGGLLTLSQNVAGGNLYPGGLTINAGGTVESRGNASGSNLGTGTLTLNGGTLQARYNNFTGGVNSPVLVTANSTIDVASAGAPNITGMTFTTLSIGTQTLNLAGGNNYTVTFTGATSLTGDPTFDVSDSGGTRDDLVLNAVNQDATPRSVTKTGNGVLAFNGNAAHTGATNVDEGTLKVLASGSISGSTAINVAAGATFDVAALAGGFTVAAGRTLTADGTVTGSLVVDGTLSGSGSVSGATTVNGTLEPGNSPGTMDFGNSITFGAGSNLSLEFGGANPGDSPGFYSQVNMTNAAGSITLDSTATLSLSLSYTPTIGDIYFILNRADSAAYATFFVGAGEGATVDLGSGAEGTITYLANWTGAQLTSEFNPAVAGNDVAILVTIPEPGSLATLLGGFGVLLGLQRFRRRTL